MPCPRSPRVGAAPEHPGGASVVRAVQGRRGPGRGPARWWSSALRTGSRGPESWGAGPGDWSPGVLFCLGWSLTARVLSGARLLPFLSWGADAASASCRLLLPRQQPRARHGAQSQTGVAGSRTPGPGREVAGEGPWAGLCVGAVSSISAAWVVSGTPGLGRGRPSRAHSPWRGLRNPALSLALPASSAGRRAAVFPWPHLERVTQGVGGRGPGCSRLPGERKHPLPAPATAPPGLSPRKQDEACLGPARLSPAVGGRQNCAPTGRLGPPRELGGAGESILAGLVFLLPEAAAGNVVLQREACRAGGTVPGTQRGEFLV